MIEVSLFIPLTNNRGRRFAASRHLAFERYEQLAIYVRYLGQAEVI